MFSHAHLRLEVSKVMGVAPNQPSHTPISQADGGDTVIPSCISRPMSFLDLLHACLERGLHFTKKYIETHWI